VVTAPLVLLVDAPARVAPDRTLDLGARVGGGPRRVRIDACRERGTPLSDARLLCRIARAVRAVALDAALLARRRDRPVADVAALAADHHRSRLVVHHAPSLLA